ncbi:MAG: hypothetical protein QM778_21120 [Myxococcales bacterium]
MKKAFAPVLCALTALSSCLDPALTRDEAQDAVDSITLATSAETLGYDVIEISTQFTLGKAVEQAAEQLRSFAVSQIPCSNVSLLGTTITVDFGGLDDACTYRGHTYAGVVQYTVEAASGMLQVHHEWLGLSNGTTTVDGSADVTWTGADATRHVSYHITATSTDQPGTLDMSGAITQTLLDQTPSLTGGTGGGIEINGTREWFIQEGDTWKLDVEHVQARAQDPVPQAGRYRLTTPSDKEVTMTFGRISATEIRVTVVGPRNRTYEIDVFSLGN